MYILKVYKSHNNLINIKTTQGEVNLEKKGKYF